TDDAATARQMAAELSSINDQRRQLQAEMVADAEQHVAELPDEDADGVVVYRADWHPGVVGLVASRLKERLHRPVVAFAPAEPGSDMLRGSARCIPGLHVRDALVGVEARKPGLMRGFGGHAMAAGLQLEAADLDGFRQAFRQAVAARLDEELRQAVIWSDG